MVILKPFRALRPKTQELAEKIASTPYDVIDSDEAREIVEKNQYSFLRVIKPEADLPEFYNGEITIYDDKVYKKAEENLQKFIESSYLVKDEKPQFYIYRQIMGNREQYGIAGCISSIDYWENNIKKHENTIESKEQDRIRHIDTVNANTGPVLLFYPGKEKIDVIVHDIAKDSPIYDFISEDNIQHTVWAVPMDDKISQLEDAFKDVNHLYIADGHHRIAAGATIAKQRAKANLDHDENEEYNYILAVVFPAEDLKIFDYNRVVKDLNGLSREEFFRALTQNFDVVDDYYRRSPKQKGSFGMYFEGKWYLLRVKNGSFNQSDPIKSLDVSILMDNLLSPILGIDDPRTDDRIDFVGGIRGMDELEGIVDSGEMKIAFSLYPITIEEVMNVAGSGLTLPPKSTWFEPKLRSGLLIHKL